MPIYEYACTHCGEHTEILQKISDAPATLCPACNTESLTKLVSASAFHLKGSGWYVTDFKNSQQSAASKSDEKPSSTTPTSSETKQEKDTCNSSTSTDTTN